MPQFQSLKRDFLQNISLLSSFTSSQLQLPGYKHELTLVPNQLGTDKSLGQTTCTRGFQMLWAVSKLIRICSVRNSHFILRLQWNICIVTSIHNQTKNQLPYFKNCSFSLLKSDHFNEFLQSCWFPSNFISSLEEMNCNPVPWIKATR